MNISINQTEGQKQAYQLYLKYMEDYYNPLEVLENNLMLFLKDEDKVNSLLQYVKKHINSGQVYLDRQVEIQKLINRVNIKLSFYKRWDEKNIYTNKFDRLPEEEKDRIRNISFSFPWNYFNDMLDDLQRQLQDNYGDYQDWHFEKYGWCAY
ncbi:MAG: hypothetical protein ACK5M3_05545 [Dysgonomonas sp.]